MTTEPSRPRAGRGCTSACTRAGKAVQSLHVRGFSRLGRIGTVCISVYLATAYQDSRFLGTELALYWVMNAVLQNLLKLQVLEFGDVAGKHIDSQAAELRALIPQPFLG